MSSTVAYFTNAVHAAIAALLGNLANTRSKGIKVDPNGNVFQVGDGEPLYACYSKVACYVSRAGHDTTRVEAYHRAFGTALHNVLDTREAWAVFSLNFSDAKGHRLAAFAAMPISAFPHRYAKNDDLLVLDPAQLVHPTYSSSDTVMTDIDLAFTMVDHYSRDGEGNFILVEAEAGGIKGYNMTQADADLLKDDHRVVYYNGIDLQDEGEQESYDWRDDPITGADLKAKQVAARLQHNAEDAAYFARD